MNKYDKMWGTSTMPSVMDLQGTFEVNVTSGIFRILPANFQPWFKQINYSEGYNIIKGKKSGFFSVRIGMETINFDYYSEKNTYGWKPLLDKVRKVSDGCFLGQIYMFIMGKHRFMGYFSLNKCAKRNGNKVVKSQILDYRRVSYPHPKRNI